EVVSANTAQRIPALDIASCSGHYTQKKITQAILRCSAKGRDVKDFSLSTRSRPHMARRGTSQESKVGPVSAYCGHQWRCRLGQLRRDCPGAASAGSILLCFTAALLPKSRGSIAVPV